MTGDVVVREGDLVFRRLRGTPEDLGQILAWRREPHVAVFWDDDDEQGANMTLDDIAGHYAPRAGDATARLFVLLDGRQVGYLQWYPWAAYADEAREMGVDPTERSWGIDVFIGDPTVVGTGVGSRAVDLACRHLFAAEGAADVSLITDVENRRAQRAYEKAGMTKVRRVLDLDRRGGERVPCWLMQRRAPQEPGGSAAPR